MSRGLPKDVKQNLQKCVDAAIAAVDSYNRPGRRFRTAQFVVLIVMAWTALFHAIFYKRGTKPWYEERTGKRIRYKRVDGEPRFWELKTCLDKFYQGKICPEKSNLEMLIGLRNKIEHRNIPELDPGLFGECQSSLINLEEMIVREFGESYSLQDQLSISIQFSSFFDKEKLKAISKALKSDIDSVVDYVESFRSTLPKSILDSSNYSFSVYLVPKTAKKEKMADAVVSFIDPKNATKEEIELIDRINVITKEKYFEVASNDKYKPKTVVEMVSKRSGVPFSVNDHTVCWKAFEVRPKNNSSCPERTKIEYCVYDRPHNDYLYTQKWIERLVGICASSEEYEKVLGKPYPSSKIKEGV